MILPNLSNQCFFPLAFEKFGIAIIIVSVAVIQISSTTGVVVFHFRAVLFCRQYYLEHGFGDPVVIKEGVLCGVAVKEFCRTRIEAVTTSAGNVSNDFLHAQFLHTLNYWSGTWCVSLFTN